MYTLNDNQRSHLRYAISELSRCETKRHNLSDEQLMLLFRILCYGAPVSYCENSVETNGAGWFTQDLF